MVRFLLLCSAVILFPLVYLYLEISTRRCLKHAKGMRAVIRDEHFRKLVEAARQMNLVQYSFLQALFF
jgi:hypothetical protein